ncbi:bifunctional isocitrate dehydrogenase kinase/phosphatase [Sedimenticola hydrogenitrophicus]|uniref:bifunctional isocitrate dehydrogenase kinase/phosphatase n=1 Tax=Sedimenticola hydrogenitrophicus TaxID=2967975 RepID=UPI0021A96206|nr:bifunctional isocitrate dehydrogenase kinase/phosphatase [Sedimenticola hydrogenitrophicus]
MTDLAQQLARTIFTGFERHFSFFQEITRQVRQSYEQADWEAIRQASVDRISFYDRRVQEAIDKVRSTFDVSQVDDALWQRVKTQYQQFLVNYRRPELAETFYNSVFCKMFARQYFDNDKIFIESGVDREELTRRDRVFMSFHLKDGGLETCLREILSGFYFRIPYQDMERDIQHVAHAFRTRSPFGQLADDGLRIDVLEAPFYRNKAAYLIGRVVSSEGVRPLVLPLLNYRGTIFVDSLLTSHEEVEALFSFARAYFMANNSIPAATVSFLQSIMPNKPLAELYMSIGFHKQAKNEFYRDLLRHLNNSNDRFIVAPGVRGLVMMVFTLPSYPFVFKVIRDRFAPQKNITHAQVKQRYLQVKLHDRVGRMADTLEFSKTAFPRDRIDPELLAELEASIPSQLERDGDKLIINHLYIEHRMTPLDICLAEGSAETVRNMLDDWGLAVKQLMAANIFPGDLLFKNFGVTHQGKVVFYDYDEICKMTECNFRQIPPPRTPEDEMSSEPWYSVGEADVFPEEFLTFLSASPLIRKTLLELHPELFDAHYWRERQQEIGRGIHADVFPYSQDIRFINQYREAFEKSTATA